MTTQRDPENGVNAGAARGEGATLVEAVSSRIFTEDEQGVEAARRWVAENDYATTRASGRNTTGQRCGAWAQRTGQSRRNCILALGHSGSHEFDGPALEGSRQIYSEDLEARIREIAQEITGAAVPPLIRVAHEAAAAVGERVNRVEARIHEVVSRTTAPLVDGVLGRINRLEDFLEANGIDVGRTATPEPAPEADYRSYRPTNGPTDATPEAQPEPLERAPVGSGAAWESRVIQHARAYWPGTGADDLIAIGPIGSRGDWLLFNKRRLEVATGYGAPDRPCFMGTLRDFQERVNAHHSGPNQIHRDYNAAVVFLDTIARHR